MQVNQTQTLTYLTNLVVDTGSVSLSLQTPDGAKLGTITGYVLPDTKTIAAVYTPQQAGLFKGAWTYKVNGVSFSEPFSFWVVWTSIYTDVRDMLGASTVNVTDQTLNREFRNIDTELHDYSQMLPPYYLMNMVSNSKGLAYSDGYEQGITKLLAARIRPYTGGKRSTGEVSLFKKGTTTVQYTNGSPQSELSIEDQWIMQGMAILEANIPEIYSVALQDRAGDETMTRGPLAFPERCYPRSCGNVPAWWANNRPRGGEF